MGSNCEQKTKAIDASVGGLVWVRRRNGSWWPGRIMGFDELPESCLVSPRSGTPVKLLGREDASVDWYNLEKSKRVKAFHCGEYDECIEKAKASAANLGKKVVKYARREDAILHALEIESACKSNKHQGFHSRKDESVGVEHDDWVGQLQKFGMGNENEFVVGKVTAIEGSSTQELSQSGLSFEDPNHVSSPNFHSMQKKRRKNPNDSDDDETEKTKRMRGLEDLGMGVVPKGNSSFCHTDVSHELLQLDGASLSESNIVNGFSNGSPVNSSRDYCSSLRKRRSQVVNAYESLKKKNRRRPLTKVLESTVMVAVPVVCAQGASPGGSSPQGLTDSKVSALESAESKKTSISVVINNNSDSTVVSCEKETSLNASDHTCDAGVDAFPFLSEMRDNEFSSASEFPDNDCSDSLFDVPFVGEEKHTGGSSPLFACSSRKLQSGAGERESNHYSQVRTISLRTEGLDESDPTSVAAHVSNVNRRIEKGTSKWQLKGKRNSRNLSKKMNKHLDSRRPRGSDNQSDRYLVGIQHMDEYPACNGRKVEIGPFDRCLTSDNCSQLVKSELVPEGLGNKPHHWSWSNQISHREMHMGHPGLLDSSKYRKHKLGSEYDAFLTTNGKESQSSYHEKSLVDKSTKMRSKEPLFPRRSPVSPLTTQRLLPQHQSHFTPYSKYQIADAPIRSISGCSSLYDVKLDVRASYRGQHVPLVSLMSKLDGKAIVGHPVTVEALDDSYCDLLMNNNDCCPASSSCEIYGVARENMLDESTYVPNKSLLLGGDESSGGALQALTSSAVQSHVEYSRNPFKHLMGQSSLSPKKSPKIKKCGILSKKTRRLSSFAVTYEPGEDKRKPVVEKLGGPVIACVPLKVVFSRINEAVNCSRLAHRGTTSSSP